MSFDFRFLAWNKNICGECSVFEHHLDDPKREGVVGRVVGETDKELS